MAHKCALLTPEQQRLVAEAGTVFPRVKGSRGEGKNEKGQYRLAYNKQILVAMVKALCEGSYK